VIETDTDDVIARIREIGGQLVILDEDLADLYGVAPAELRAMVRRNKAAFTVEFVIPVVLEGNRRRNLAFTEHGVIVAASMLGDGIEELSIHVVRAFVKLREAKLNVARRIEVLGEAVTSLDARIFRQFAAIYEALGISVGQRLH
jgi:hypothetical protein